MIYEIHTKSGKIKYTSPNRIKALKQLNKVAGDYLIIFFS